MARLNRAAFGHLLAVLLQILPVTAVPNTTAQAQACASGLKSYDFVCRPQSRS
jgi:hypothetical protein